MVRLPLLYVLGSDFFIAALACDLSHAELLNIKLDLRDDSDSLLHKLILPSCRQRYVFASFEGAPLKLPHSYCCRNARPVGPPATSLYLRRGLFITSH